MHARLRFSERLGRNRTSLIDSVVKLEVERHGPLVLGTHQ
jgi:hypothetical protein